MVDQWHRGDFTTISQAIKQADPGSRILVHSGIYDEGLILDKPLEIVGDGNLGEVVIRAEGKNAISFKAARGIVCQPCAPANWRRRFFLCGYPARSSGAGRMRHNQQFLSMCGNTWQSISKAQRQQDPRWQGRRDLCLRERPGTDRRQRHIRKCFFWHRDQRAGNPTVRGNKIHDGNKGIFARTARGSKITTYSEMLSGIEIREAGNPTVRGNKIHDGKSDLLEERPGTDRRQRHIRKCFIWHRDQRSWQPNRPGQSHK